MLSSIHIQGFKGFKDTKIEPLRRVNLIVGGQNSGKTSLLEAIYLNSLGTRRLSLNPSYIGDFLKEANFRNASSNRLSKWVANHEAEKVSIFSFEPATPFEQDGVRFSQKMIEDGFSTSIFNVFAKQDSDLVSFYDQAVFKKKKQTIVSLLKQIDSRVCELESVNSNGDGQAVHVDIGLRDLVPLTLLGQGFNRLVHLYSGLLGQGAKSALIDEIENGIHYSALPTVWQGIANIARELDIQLFITTHSYECIQAAAKVFEATPEEFQVIRLERTGDNVDAKCIPGDRVASVLERGWEIR